MRGFPPTFGVKYGSGEKQLQLSEYDIEVQAVICLDSLRGSFIDDYLTRGGVGTLFQGLRHQYTTTHDSRRLNKCSDDYLDGSNKDDVVFRPGDERKSVLSSLFVFLFSFPGIETGSDTSLTFCLHADSTEGLLLFQFAYYPNIYNHNSGAENAQFGCKLRALLVIILQAC